jgi:ABC-type nickel/cobalt efflux system permease component RcnA
MNDAAGWLLVGAVAAVGVLHTVVPDHWLPIALIARQRGWSRAETARVAFQAGLGHVLSTLAIAMVAWLAGIAVATRFGPWVDTGASLALIAFGGWIAISAWRELHSTRGGREGEGHHHDHHHHGGSENPSSETRSRTALLLILGSSPMVEGIPAFFAASKYGIAIIVIMSVVFAATTIATYVVLCVYSTASLQRIRLGAFERYGEVLSGGLIAVVGLTFWIWPVL